MRGRIGCAVVLACLVQNTGWCGEEKAAEEKTPAQNANAEQNAAAPKAEKPKGVPVDDTSVLIIGAPAVARDDQKPAADLKPAEAAAAANTFDFFEGIVEVIANELAPVQAPARAIGRGREAQFEAQVKQMLPHFVQQLRPVLSAELAFIRQVCDVPEEKRPRIKAAGEASLQTAATALARQQFGNGPDPFGARNAPPDPRQVIGDALTKALEENLTSEQLAGYSSEAAKRIERRKQAAILCAVSQLDEALWLTERQRQQVSDSISAHWQGKWEQWLVLLRYGGTYYPQIPDEYIVSHLNEEQKSVWSGLQKVDFGSWAGVEAQVQDDDGWWGDEPAKPAAAAGVIAPPVRVFFQLR